MTTISVRDAEHSLSRLITESQTNHHPIHIVGENGSAVLMSEEDWTAIEETLAISSIPDMTNRLLASRAEPLSECATELEW